MRIAAWVLMLTAVWTAGGAEAADWTVTKLHGMVYAEAASGGWVRLSRGDAVVDGRAIRTLRSGNAVFARGSETVAFGPGTQAEITDRPGRRPFTTVLEQIGTVGVSAEALAVRHFSVETPYLVAVVKGTEFTVRTDAGGSDVAVSRGLVSVTSRSGRRTVLLPAGQSVETTPYGAMLVSGMAVPALVHPRIGGMIEDVTADGATVDSSAQDDSTDSLGGSGLLRGSLDDVSGVGATLGGAVTGLGDTAGSVITGAGEAAGGTVDAVGAALGNSSGALGSAVNAVGATTTTLGGAVSSVGTTAGGTVTGLSGTAGGAVTSLTGTVSGAVNGLTQPAGSASGTGSGGGLLQHLGL
jgi:FecR protein